MTKDIEKVIEWLAVAASHPKNSADDESEIYELMEKLEGCVVVPVENLNKTIEAIEDMFEDDPTLALGELLPIQQDIKAMLEAARGGNE